MSSPSSGALTSAASSLVGLPQTTMTAGNQQVYIVWRNLLEALASKNRTAAVALFESLKQIMATNPTSFKGLGWIARVANSPIPKRILDGAAAEAAAAARVTRSTAPLGRLARLCRGVAVFVRVAGPIGFAYDFLFGLGANVASSQDASAPEKSSELMDELEKFASALLQLENLAAEFRLCAFCGNCDYWIGCGEACSDLGYCDYNQKKPSDAGPPLYRLPIVTSGFDWCSKFKSNGMPMADVPVSINYSLSCASVTENILNLCATVTATGVSPTTPSGSKLRLSLMGSDRSGRRYWRTDSAIVPGSPYLWVRIGVGVQPDYIVSKSLLFGELIESTWKTPVSSDDEPITLTTQDSAFVDTANPSTYSFAVAEGACEDAPADPACAVSATAFQFPIIGLVNNDGPSCTLCTNLNTTTTLTISIDDPGEVGSGLSLAHTTFADLAADNCLWLSGEIDFCPEEDPGNTRYCCWGLYRANGNGLWTLMLQNGNGIPDAIYQEENDGDFDPLTGGILIHLYGDGDTCFGFPETVTLTPA